MKFIEKIFSVKNNETRTNKVITLLGIKIKLKKKHLTIQEKNNTETQDVNEVLDQHIQELLNQNTSLKNSAKKKRCFILATGPSIKEQDLKLLAGEDVFSISNFFLHEDIETINPKYHFFAPYHEPLILQNYIDWLNLADEKLPKSTKMVLATSNEYLVKEYNLFTNREIIYVEFKGIDLEEPINIDITKPIMAPQTGPIMILPVCAYIGYKEIYLVGQDMNRMASYGGTTQNFYENDPRVNATDKNNWIDIIPELERTLIMFKQFKKYADYFKEKKIKFYNLSPISWLSFVEKKDFNKILNKQEDTCKNQ